MKKVFGLRETVGVGEPKFLESHPEQWSAPLISEDQALAFIASNAGVLRAIWIATGKELWVRKDLGRFGRAMAQTGDVLLVGSNTDLVALVGYSGKELWRVPLAGFIGGSITIASGVAYVPVRPNQFVAVDLEAKKELWRVKRPVPEGITVRGQAPVTVDPAAKRAYLGFSDGALTAVSMTDGSQIWSVQLGRPRKLFADVDAQPILQNGGRTLLAASYNGGLYALEAANGREVWKKPDVLHLTALVPAPKSKWLIGSVGDGEVLGISKKSGAVGWRYKMAKSVPTEAVWVGHGIVVVGASEEASAVLEVATGRPIQLLASGSGVSVPPATRGAELVLLSNKGLVQFYRWGEGTGSTH